MEVINKYYVYAILDPRFPSEKHGKWKFAHKPIYIGKGKGSRCKGYERGKSHNKSVTYRMSQIYETSGMYCVLRILKKDLTEQQAFVCEKDLISKIGRQWTFEGPLLNLTDGGEGISGRVISDFEKEHKSNMSKLALRMGHEAFAARVKRINPKIKLRDNYVSITETPEISVRLSCGCLTVYRARDLMNITLPDTCFSCNLQERVAFYGLTVLSKPTSSRKLVKYRCDEGHEFTQQARMQLFGQSEGCKVCNLQNSARNKIFIHPSLEKKIINSTLSLSKTAEKYGITISLVRRVKDCHMLTHGRKWAEEITNKQKIAASKFK